MFIAPNKFNRQQTEKRKKKHWDVLLIDLDVRQIGITTSKSTKKSTPGITFVPEKDINN